MTECIACGATTDLHIAAQIGDQTGHLCSDCAYWCDGNIIEAA